MLIGIRCVFAVASADGCFTCGQNGFLKNVPVVAIVQKKNYMLFGGSCVIDAATQKTHCMVVAELKSVQNGKIMMFFPNGHGLTGTKKV